MDEFMTQFERYKNELYRYALRTVWDRGVAEDVFAAAVLAAWENWHRFEPGSNFRAWMYKILTNKCFVANRDTMRTPRPLDDTPESSFVELGNDRGYADILEDSDRFMQECGDEVHRAFAHCSPKERACLLLRAEKLSYNEIAEVMGIPAPTVMTHLARGRAKLRSELLEYARERGLVRNLPRLLEKEAPDEHTQRMQNE
ncbi:MAG: sigma-70 family RNA polymerase sigma factor [Candidatus Hydrogenedens sp.]|nr:sigma-70 family RNA polymerase sigma factor [Candidatus Hydrogenedens sp.]